MGSRAKASARDECRSRVRGSQLNHTQMSTKKATRRRRLPYPEHSDRDSSPRGRRGHHGGRRNRRGRSRSRARTSKNSTKTQPSRKRNWKKKLGMPRIIASRRAGNRGVQRGRTNGSETRTARTVCHRRRHRRDCRRRSQKSTKQSPSRKQRKPKKPNLKKPRPKPKRSSMPRLEATAPSTPGWKFALRPATAAFTQRAPRPGV